MKNKNLHRRTFLNYLASVPVFLLLPTGVAVAARLRIEALRHWPEPEKSRLVLDVDRAAKFQTSISLQPPQVVVRIIEAELAVAIDQAIPNDDQVERIRTRRSGDHLEIVVDLKRACEVNSFTLPPNDAGKGHRIVLDIAPKLTRQEVEALRQRTARRIEVVRKSGDRIVAIDPGHGGEDPGTVWGRSLREKETALEVSRLLQKQIDALPGVRAILTREGDYFVPLHKRQRIANQFAADIFVSIHVNSARNRTARGAEVFFLSLKGAVDRTAKELVDRENAADMVGGLPAQRINEPLVDILMGMKRDSNMKESERLAELLLDSMGEVRGSAVRSVKQGPLAVLKSIQNPSVLVELGFFTNPQDRKLLASPRVQIDFAERLTQGIRKYFG